MVEEQYQQQQHQGLIEDFIEFPKGLSESSNMCAVVFPKEKREEILPFITEGGSAKEKVEGPLELVLNPFPTNNPLTVSPSTNQVYILPMTVARPTPEAPNTKASPSLPAMQNFKRLVPLYRILPLHKNQWQQLTSHDTTDGSGAGSDLKHPNLDISKLRQFQQPPKA